MPSVHDQHKEDRELALETRAGSVSAFEELVSRYERRVYRFARRMCGNDEDAREITQDTFLSVFRAIESYDPRRKFQVWVFAIARRKSIDKIRSRKRTPELVPLDDATVEAPRASDRGAVAPAGIWGWAEKILPALQYQALWLRYAEDMTVAELAGVLGLTTIYAKVLLFRGRQRLVKALAAAPNTQCDLGTKPRSRREAHLALETSL